MQGGINRTSPRPTDGVYFPGKKLPRFQSAVNDKDKLSRVNPE
jgi:hypothetical protein